jgi:hypothetical protein
MVTIRTLRAACFGLLVSAFAVAAQAQTAPINAGANIIDFPMVGVGFNQTFQINVAAPDPCAVQFQIYDSNGILIAQQSVGIGGTGGAGKLTIRSFSISDVVKIPRQRAELRAMVLLTPVLTPMATPVSVCEARGTVEISDGLTHITSVVAPELPAVQAGALTFELGPVSHGEFQAVRLNVVAIPPGPCAGTLGFLDASGNPIGPSSTVSLSPGQAAFLDLPPKFLVPGFLIRNANGGASAQVLPVFTAMPAAAASAGVCVTSVEVYDEFTGWTHVFMPPGPPISPVLTPG